MKHVDTHSCNQSLVSLLLHVKHFLNAPGGGGGGVQIIDVENTHVLVFTWISVFLMECRSIQIYRNRVTEIRFVIALRKLLLCFPAESVLP